MKWFAFLTAVAAAALTALYLYEDPFLKRWPSPRYRKQAERLRAMHDMYETQPWV